MEGSANSFRKAGMSRGGASSAAVNFFHWRGGRTKCVRSARALSAAGSDELTTGSLGLTRCMLVKLLVTADAIVFASPFLANIFLPIRRPVLGVAAI